MWLRFKSLIGFALMFCVPHQLLAQEKCPAGPALPPAIAKEFEHLQSLLKSENVPERTATVSISSQKIDLRYKVYPSSVQPKKGRILYLCGGPGAPCDFERHPLQSAPGYEVVVADYPGVGKNVKHNQTDFMSIENQGLAMAQLAEQTNTDLIYGTSFGTTVATVAASHLTKNGKSQLRGVFLEGVVGRGNSREYSASFVAQSEKVWNTLSAKEQGEFKANYQKVSQQLNAEEKEAFDRNLTLTVSEGNAALAKHLKELGLKPIAQLKIELKGRENWRKRFQSDSSFNHLRAAGCQVLGLKKQKVPERIFGDTVPFRSLIPTEMCDCRPHKKSWNPGEHQIKDIPIIYLNSRDDPNTPIDWAMEHFNGQQTAKKVFLAPEGGGHMTSFLEPMASCMSPLFDSLMLQDLSKVEKEKWTRNGCQPAAAPPTSTGRN